MTERIKSITESDWLKPESYREMNKAWQQLKAYGVENVSGVVNFMIDRYLETCRGHVVNDQTKAVIEEEIAQVIGKDIGGEEVIIQSIDNLLTEKWYINGLIVPMEIGLLDKIMEKTNKIVFFDQAVALKEKITHEPVKLTPKGRENWQKIKVCS